jgi:hypothetical protein
MELSGVDLDLVASPILSAQKSPGIGHTCDKQISVEALDQFSVRVIVLICSPFLCTYIA